MVFDPFLTFVLLAVLIFVCANFERVEAFWDVLNASIKQVFGYFEQIYESVQKMT